MALIRVKEIFADNHSVTIQVDGILDHESLPILKDICTHHFRQKKSILLDLCGVTRISRESRAYLRKIRPQISGLTFSVNYELMSRDWN